MLLPPGQTRNAVVVCYIPPNIDIGTKDKITFTSQGMNLAGQSAILTVTSPTSAGLVRENYIEEDKSKSSSSLIICVHYRIVERH